MPLIGNTWSDRDRKRRHVKLLRFEVDRDIAGTVRPDEAHAEGAWVPKSSTTETASPSTAPGGRDDSGKQIVG